VVNKGADSDDSDSGAHSDDTEVMTGA